MKVVVLSRRSSRLVSALATTITITIALAATILLLFVGVAFAHVEDDQGDGWSNWSGWSHRVPITITNLLNAPLRDQQVKVTLEASNFEFDRAQASGADLRFTDENGTKLLNHWVEAYDAANRRATVWVKVPELPTEASKTIYLYYGNPGAEDLASGGRTFEMFDDFGQPGLGYYDFGPPTTVMTKTEAWETQAPHTLSVIELNRDGYKYWGYYGLADCGGIGLARSNDLVNWQKAAQPLLNKDGERWPSAQKVGDTIYMIYDRDYCGTSHLVLRTSKDGMSFSDPYKVIVEQELGIRNQNPALFRDPNGGRFYLYWYRGGNELGRWQIKMRSADTVEGLADPSSEKVLIDAPYELAAPNMMFHDGAYFLSTEINENAWKTKIYAGSSPLGPFTPLPDSPQLSDNQACLFQHVIGETMHGYICKDTGAGWVLNHRAADLSKGRSQQRKLNPSVWTPLSGAWQPVESKDVADTIRFAPGIVLSGTGHGLLKTALPGTDYVFEARGRSVGNSKWGLGVRVQDEANLYLVEVEVGHGRVGDGRRVMNGSNGGSTIRLYRVVNGERVELAEMANPEVDALNWAKLTVAVHDNELAVWHADRAAFKVTDPESRFASGNSALWVEGGHALFDQVTWRKFVPGEPGVSIGATEASDTVNDRIKNSPLLVAMAATTLVVGLGILVVGFARSRR